MTCYKQKEKKLRRNINIFNLSQQWWSIVLKPINFLEEIKLTIYFNKYKYTKKKICCWSGGSLVNV